MTPPPDSKLEIIVDPAVLDKVSKDLTEAATSLAEAARDAGSVSVSPGAFGAFNIALGTVASTMALHTTELLGVSALAVGALSETAAAAARDWVEAEQNTADELQRADSDLNAARGVLNEH